MGDLAQQRLGLIVVDEVQVPLEVPHAAVRDAVGHADRVIDRSGLWGIAASISSAWAKVLASRGSASYIPHLSRRNDSQFPLCGSAVD